MRFVKKIGDGDVTIKDNEVIEKSVDEKSDEWVNEFSSSSQHNRQVQLEFTHFLAWFAVILD